jgi:sugar lactone lactonase YvrE
MTSHLTAELVVDARAVVGEGPVWDARASVLWWVDIEGRHVHRFDPASGTDTSFATPSMVGAVAVRAGGGLVLALADRLVLVDLPVDGALPRDFRPFVDFDDGPGIRSNDGKCDPSGRFLIGRMALDERPVGRLLSVGADGSSRTRVEAVSISNGLAWSADGRTLYYIDTPTRRIDAFDYDPAGGEVSNRRVHLDLGSVAGSPDGMTIDAEGCLWVALWGGSAVRRYAPDGALMAVVSVAASQVTSCTFGGPDLSDLYITTAARDVDEPHAGGLFRVRPGVRGMPTDVFGG